MVERLTQFETGDQPSDDELRATFPILVDQCAESIRELARFDPHQWEWSGERYVSRIVVFDRLDEHARILLTCVQRELRMRPSPLPLEAAVELSRSRRVALQALQRLGESVRNSQPDGNRYAKAVQVEVAGQGSATSDLHRGRPRATDRGPSFHGARVPRNLRGCAVCRRRHVALVVP